MVKYIIALAIIVAFYAIIINKVYNGRCFRYEYIIKTIIIFMLELLFIILLRINTWPFLNFLYSDALLVLMYFSLRNTIQRFYDLNLSGWYILLKLIPVFSIFVTLYLYFKKGNHEINEYDRAINYKKILKGKHCIDIYKDKFIIENDIYQYEKYSGKYIIKISKYSEEKVFKKYL